jgi:hypothetical protein
VANQTLDPVSDTLKHSPNLVFLALLKCDLDASESTLIYARAASILWFNTLNYIDITGNQAPPIELCPRAQYVESRLRRTAADHNLIDFQDTTTWTSGSLHEVAIISQKYKTPAIKV